jgi:hypothetical protein
MPLIIWLWFVALRESQPTKFILSILTVEEEKANTIIVGKSIFAPLILHICTKHHMAMLQDLGNIKQSIFSTSKRDQSQITHKKSKESRGENG